MSDQGTKPAPNLFATAARGTEGALRDELRELKFQGVRADRGGVHFAGGLAEAARACLWLRTALRVLFRLSAFEAPDGEALYEGVRAIDWTPYLTPRHTLAIRAVCRDSALSHSQFIAQKAKDAIVDQLRDRTGSRPSVDLEDPDVTLFVHVVKDLATVYLDVSGESLHRRGYRMSRLEAPLKENLAAAMLRLSGWDRVTPLLDPMCGSGTIPIEAALWAGGTAPGLLRGKFGVERWASHDEEAARKMAALREAARAAAAGAGKGARVEIVGSDVDPAALLAAESNAQTAGVKVEWRRRSVADLKEEWAKGMIVTNPPYGERMEVGEGFYQEMGRAFGRLRSYRIAVLAGAPSVVGEIRRRYESMLTVYNGDIECRLVVYGDSGTVGKRES